MKRGRGRGRVVISSSIAFVSLNFLKMSGDERAIKSPFLLKKQAVHLWTATDRLLGYLPCAMSNNDDRGIAVWIPLNITAIKDRHNGQYAIIPRRFPTGSSRTPCLAITTPETTTAKGETTGFGTSSSSRDASA
jgi:hypothetical protein